MEGWVKRAGIVGGGVETVGRWAGSCGDLRAAQTRQRIICSHKRAFDPDKPSAGKTKEPNRILGVLMYLTQSAVVATSAIMLLAAAPTSLRTADAERVLCGTHAVSLLSVTQSISYGPVQISGAYRGIKPILSSCNIIAIYASSSQSHREVSQMTLVEIASERVYSRAKHQSGVITARVYRRQGLQPGEGSAAK